MPVLLDALVKEGFLTREQVNDARDKQAGAKKPIHELLVEMGFLSEDDLIAVSSRVFGMPVSNLDEEKIDSSILKLISYDKARRYGVFPLRQTEDVLFLAMSDPRNIIALDDLELLTKLKIKPVLCTKSDINRYIEKYYYLNDALYDLLKNVADNPEVEMTETGSKGYDLKSAIDEHSPIIRLVNLILSDSVKMRASDIHIEPQEKSVDVRYRIDGQLKNVLSVPGEFSAYFLARIKVLAQLDIAEKRKPQDGRSGIIVDGRRIDLRISTVPTFYGEKAVIRLLDPKSGAVRLDEIVEGEEFETFREATERSQGLILIRGPTGSGKTTTLYAILNYVKGETKNIVTIEDPIEYLVQGISQIQVDPVRNVTFATGLRSILRQDPDIVLVGEIRDRETADIAFRASLTGHLVFSTLHTNNSAATITRVMDIGLEPFLISSSVILIAAQRLVRLICPYCREEYMPDKELVQRFKSYADKYNVTKFFRGDGCERCNFTGYSGRVAIFEILKMNEKLTKLVSEKASEDEIFREARKDGLETLAEAGVKKVAAGLTTLDEILSVADISEDVPEVEQPKEDKKTPRILIVDDEEDLLKILGKRLGDAGYEVVKAGNGREAIGAALVDQFDLIIMDVMMPVMDGFEATKILRSQLQTASIPIIMLTAKTDKESELQGLDAGADDYITKPFSSDKLLARVKMLLRRAGEKNEDSQ